MRELNKGEKYLTVYTTWNRTRQMCEVAFYKPRLPYTLSASPYGWNQEVLSKKSYKNIFKNTLLPFDLRSQSGEHVGRPHEKILQTSGNYACKRFEKMQNALVSHILQNATAANMNRQGWQSKHTTAHWSGELLLVRNIRSTSRDEITGYMKNSSQGKTKSFFFFN